MEGEEKGEEEEVSEKMRRRKGWEWREMGDRGEGRREKILGDQRCRTRDTSFGTQKAVSTKSNPGREAKRAKKKCGDLLAKCRRLWKQTQRVQTKDVIL